ncbi:helix-turn-helix domain-containing protein [Flavihumibacter solisilvae]|uniref:helix-turn-helix domain-containing protein n=1 Tax=Flavihumibacter solisilvae TaxID=1349421 RepID=UPI00068A7CD9|nr:helix-turn-helix domain-containing protein [Flavihumibacter solisilvae]
MNWKEQIIRDHGLAYHVKDILIFEDSDNTRRHILPFYADGYPGIVFQQTKNGMFLEPGNKLLADFFLYGQTILPIELCMEGAYRFIVFQLHPVAVKALTGIDPKKLNDDCYDLHRLTSIDTNVYTEALQKSSDVITQSEIIARFITQLLMVKVYYPHASIVEAIEIIIKSKGKISVRELTETLHMTERTLQRNFIEHVGIPPKKFAKIIQFHSSFNQVTAESYSRLTDIVFENGFADQSHFIRDFKKFTGLRPNEMQVKKP